MTTHAKTRALNEAYPPGTIVDFLDAEGARRTGSVVRAESGLLVVESPPPPKRRAHGLPKATWDGVTRRYHIDVVGPSSSYGLLGLVGAEPALFTRSRSRRNRPEVSA